MEYPLPRRVDSWIEEDFYNTVDTASPRTNITPRFVQKKKNVLNK